MNANISVNVMFVGDDCFSLFVDINNNLYCSMQYSHKVISKSLNISTNTSIIVAGNGSYGQASNMLYAPRGIFVDINFDLYVADYSNDRIQLFQQGTLNGITVAGSGSSTITISLYRPTGIILDADKYLYIIEYGSHRIVGQGPTGFRCLVGCNGGGSASNQLTYPYSLAFDIYGNLFVADTNNNRIQKFVLSSNSSICGKILQI